jgi:hypothetical protein
MLINHRRYTMTPHCRIRLLERYGLTSLPDKHPEFFLRISNDVKVYLVGEVYVMISLRKRKMLTVLLEETMKKPGGITASLSE